MRWLVACALCGCNRILGIDPIRPVIDAQQFDAPFDAPYACPPIGLAPHFSTAWHTIKAADCSGYSIGNSSAMAICSGGPAYGYVDQSLAPVTFTGLSGTVLRPMLSPEGDAAFATWFDSSTGTQRLASFTRAMNSWGLAQMIVSGAAGISGSNPTRLSGPRHLVYWDTSSNSLVEMVEMSGAWIETGTQSAAQLGITSASNPSMTPDGLRLVMRATANGSAFGIWYADRPAIDQPFAQAVDLQVTSDAVSPFMTLDCGRLYFEAGNQIVFAAQL